MDDFIKYYNKIYKNIYHKLKKEFINSNEEDLKDSISEAVCRYLENEFKINKKTINSISSWIFRCARNYLLNQLQKSKSIISYKFIEFEMISESGFFDFQSEKTEETIELKKIIPLLIKKFTPLQKAYIQMHFMEKLDDETIRLRIGQSKKSFAKFKSRCRKKFKDVIIKSFESLE